MVVVRLPEVDAANSVSARCDIERGKGIAVQVVDVLDDTMEPAMDVRTRATEVRVGVCGV